MIGTHLLISHIGACTNSQSQHSTNPRVWKSENVTRPPATVLLESQIVPVVRSQFNHWGCSVAKYSQVPSA